MVVSDTSPLVHLARIDRFPLLVAFYQHVLIPPAVWREAVEEGRGRAGEAEVREAVKAGWMDVRLPQGEVLVRNLKKSLDDGEAEAIALAVETNANLVLIDERQAREEAGRLGLSMAGTIGVLI